MQRDITAHGLPMLDGQAGVYAIRVPGLDQRGKDAVLKYWKDRLSPTNRFLKKHWLKGLSEQARGVAEERLRTLDPAIFIKLQ